MVTMQTIIPKMLSDTMYHRTIPVLIYQINYPFFITTCSNTSAQIINEYYYQTSRKTEDYCRTILYPMAAERAQHVPSNLPFNHYTIDVIYRITYNFACITSLYLETYTYLGGAHGETKRVSNTWDFETGAQIQLQDIYPLTSASLNNLQEYIRQQIEERMQLSPSSYFQNYNVLLKNSFRQENFYLSPESLTIYYQQYEIAPYATGIPEFSIPFPMMQL